MSRRIAVVPAYNESPTVIEVLEQLEPLVDHLVIVDDGSTDDTRAKIQAWLPGHDTVKLLTFDENQGMSAAYYAAFTDLKQRLGSGNAARRGFNAADPDTGCRDYPTFEAQHR